jgi:hypothetical protein
MSSPANWLIIQTVSTEYDIHGLFPDKLLQSHHRVRWETAVPGEEIGDLFIRPDGNTRQNLTRHRW